MARSYQQRSIGFLPEGAAICVVPEQSVAPGEIAELAIRREPPQAISHFEPGVAVAVNSEKACSLRNVLRLQPSLCVDPHVRGGILIGISGPGLVIAYGSERINVRIEEAVGRAKPLPSRAVESREAIRPASPQNAAR